jgi:hypothetical protein
MCRKIRCDRNLKYFAKYFRKKGYYWLVRALLLRSCRVDHSISRPLHHPKRRFFLFQQMWVFPRARTRNGPSLSVLVSSVLRSSRRARAAREHHETSKRVGSGSRASREISPGPGPVVSREIQRHPSMATFRL